jgi:hypothetical protein
MNTDYAAIDLTERLQAMYRQEESIYRCEGYLSPDFQRKQQLTKDTSLPFTPILSDASSASSANGGLNEIWREKICEWSYQVVDHFDFNREIVAISLSYLDRFLATRQVNKKIFQLAAMTTLYLAIKLYEPGTLKMSSLIELSRGYFLVEHIAAMEDAVLRSLSWHVHPPTALCLIRHYLELLPDRFDRSVKHDAMELSRFLCELSVCDYFFVTRKPSSIAIAALTNALEAIDHIRFPSRSRQELFRSIELIGQIDLKQIEIAECRERLQDLYQQGGYQGNSDQVDNNRGPSPNGVEDFDNNQYRQK